MSGPGRIVVVGASVAGLAMADSLRERGYEGVLTVVGDESRAPYARPPLSKQVIAAADDQADAHPLRAPQHYGERGIDLLLGTRAFSLDPVRRLVLTTAGDLPYDALVIATGSRARTVSTTDGEVLPVLRTMDDAQWLRAMAAQHSAFVVVGAGYVGLEVAASLRAMGREVTCAGTAPLPLVSSVGPEVAAHVRDEHRAHGVDLHCGVRQVRVEGEQGSYRVTLDGAAPIETEVVLGGVGADPNVEWLEGSGVSLDAGVIVDEFGRTGLPDVYAVGDVANLPIPGTGQRGRIEHWKHAGEHGHHVAATVLGLADRPYSATPYFWTDQYDMKIQAYGRRGPQDVTEVLEGALDSDAFIAVSSCGTRLTGVVARGRSPMLRPYQKMVSRGADVSEARTHAEAQRTAASLAP